MSRPVYLAFVTAPSEAAGRYLDRIAGDHPDCTLLVAARERPSRGEWIEIVKDRSVRSIVADCRRAIAGRSLSGAAIHATLHGGEWKLRVAALAIAGPTLRIYNDHLDHFPFTDMRTLFQHGKWRWSQRPRRLLWWTALWWTALARLALTTGSMGAGRSRPPVPLAASELEPGISLVIPTRNGRDLLAAMLPGVTADLQPHTAELIIIDNGSSDGTEAFLREQYPAIRIESSARPLSFSEAVNRGIRSARYSHVVLLNNDMLIEPGFFAALRCAFTRMPDLFCATAQIFFPPGQRREETGLCFWHKNPVDDFPVYCAEPRPGEDYTLVLYGSGGCSMYDTAKLRQLGGFDEAYKPAYVEDLDIGYRAWQHGWPTVFCAGAKVEHRHRATTSRYYKTGYLDFLVERNYLRFLVRATAGIFPELWQEAIDRLRRRAIAGDRPARAALRIAWREGLARAHQSGDVDERALKDALTL